MISSTFETAYTFLSQNWQSLPLNERFIYTPWIVVAALYLILGYYDRLHSLRPQREVIESNFRTYLYISCIIPYCIFAIARAHDVEVPLQFDSDIAKFVSFIFAIAGAFLICLGRIQLNGYWGPDIYRYNDPADKKIIRTGLYRKTRHPIYFGQWLLVFGTGLSTQNIIFIAGTSVLSLVFIIGRATREERNMKDEFGPEWTDYLRKTGFFPWNGF